MGDFVQTEVKKWFRDKDCGFLENGKGPDIKVSKEDLVNCQFLKIGATVEFECHIDNKGLTAKKVRLQNKKKTKSPQNRNQGGRKNPFGVMT